MSSRISSGNRENNITDICYNVLNLPEQLQVGSGSQELLYTYDGSGRKLRKEFGRVATDYVDGIQYENEVIAFVQNETGRAIKRGSNVYLYEYNLIDHLGNVRYSFDYANGFHKSQSDDYYPFGMRIASDVSSPENKYLYNGKEFLDGIGQYDYWARFYDPVIGRWNVVDPLAEQMRRYSPYTFVYNNPLR